MPVNRRGLPGFTRPLDEGDGNTPGAGKTNGGNNIHVQEGFRQTLRLQGKFLRVHAGGGVNCQNQFKIDRL